MSDVVERIDELIADEKCWHCGRDWHGQALTQKVDRMFQNGSLDPNYFAREDTSPILCDGSTFIGPLRPEPTESTTVSYASGGSSWILNGFLDDMSGVMLKFQEMATSFAGLTSVPHLQWPQYHYTPQKWALGVNQSAPWVTFHDSSWNTLWTNKPLPCEEEPTGDLPDVDIEFGPQNWHYEFQRAPKVGKHILATHWSWSPTPHLAKKVVDLWKAFKAIPTPASRGYDFSSFKTVELTNTGPDKGSITKGFRK